MSHVVRLEDCGPDCVAEVGGKAAGLGQLLSHGFQVPSGFAVTTAAYREFVVANGIDAEIRRALATARDVVREQDASAWIRALFEEAKAAAPLAAEITSAYDRLCGGGLAPVAVRSSAVAEDTAQASFAGQQETSLWIRSGADVVRSVKRCWGSLFTPQAITYRLRFNVAPEDVVMGVVVQAMVPAEVAGVMFTIDPVTGDRSQITIEASYGLGLAVVEGAVTPDRFDVDKVTMEIRSRFPKRKQVAYRFDERAGEVRLAEVPADEQDRPCLSDQEVMEIAALGKRIERTLGAAQDIEWALGPSGPGPRELFSLQTRPETVWSKNRREPIGPPGTTAIERVLASMMTRKADVEKGDQELT